MYCALFGCRGLFPHYGRFVCSGSFVCRGLFVYSGVCVYNDVFVYGGVFVHCGLFAVVCFFKFVSVSALGWLKTLCYCVSCYANGSERFLVIPEHNDLQTERPPKKQFSKFKV